MHFQLKFYNKKNVDKPKKDFISFNNRLMLLHFIESRSHKLHAIQDALCSLENILSVHFSSLFLSMIAIEAN